MLAKYSLPCSRLFQSQSRPFSATINKRQKMELTLRTPYQAILKNFDGFQRIITKTNEAALIIQNKSPPALYLLPPGHLKIKMTQEVKGVSGDYFHLGGWAIVHMDNTCEVNLIDVIERKDVKADQFGKGEFVDEDGLVGKYSQKLRKTASKSFVKKAI